MNILFESKKERKRVFLSPLVLYYAMDLPCFANELTYSVWYLTDEYVEKYYQQLVVSENEVRFFQHFLEKDCIDLNELKLYSKPNNKELDGFIAKLGIHDIQTENNYVRYFGEIDPIFKPAIRKTQDLGFSPFLPVGIKYKLFGE